MESKSEITPEPEPSSPEPTKEELEAELKGLEVWLAVSEPGLQAAMSDLSKWIDKYIADQERAKEIRKTLGLPPTESGSI